MNSSSGTLRFKVVLLGEGRVGKTSILLRYVRGNFDDSQQSTSQASYLDKKISLTGQAVSLSIWDTAGQERFHSLVPIYYRDANGAVLVYDITDYESFSRVRKWVKELRTNGDSNICIIICGNKIDLAKDRRVTEEEATQYAESVGANHIYTSAKQGKGLDEAFNDLARKMVERRRATQPRNGKSSLRFVDDDHARPPVNKSDGCCLP